MRKRPTIGDFEAVLLRSIMDLNTEAYGATIRRWASEALGRDVAVGAVYTVLERLTQKGFVASWTGDPTAERGGRAKRFYRITGAGSAALAEKLAAQRQLAVAFGLMRVNGAAQL